MKNDKFLGLLGICRRAGRMKLGFNKSADSLKTKKAAAVFTASDISPKTEKELQYAARKATAKVIRTEYDIETLSKAIGAPAGVIAVEDEGFAKALILHLQGGNSV